MTLTRRAWCLAAVASLLGACASVPNHHPTHEGAPPFEIDGRFSLQYQHDRFIGAIRWSFTPRLETVTLQVAGQTFATFERLDQRVKATLSSGMVLEEDGWPALTLRAIGTRLPLEAAPYWLRGQPVPNKPVRRGTTDTFEQLNWTITTLARDAHNRPARLRWQNETTLLFLVIDTWRTP